MAGQPLWTRGTSWRQGSVLAKDAAEALGLVHPEPEAKAVAVVISHDCDLTCDNLDAEPDVEVVLGRIVGTANGNFVGGKSPRTLHLSMMRAGTEVIVELVATQKRICPKDVLAMFQPDGAFELHGRGLAVLRSWLSARYNRSAFPDAFVDRMRATKFDVKLAKLLEPNGHLISHVFFDLDRGKVVERQEGDPYELSIVLVSAPGEDSEQTADAADAVAEKIAEAADERFGEKKEITLRRCISVSEDQLTIAQARTMMQWRLEHMTHKSGDQAGPVAV